jgi:general secretion pathway protein C
MLNAMSSADQARVSRLAAIGVAAVAALICVWAIVKIGWLAVAPSNAAAIVSGTAPAAAGKPPVSIAKWHLFGNAQSTAMSQLASNAPATTLKLTLRGTLSLTDPKQGMAMIADDHGAESAYKVGEEITDRATLAEVYADHVVLTHEGVSETLNLPRPEEHVAAPETNLRNTASSPGGKASSIPPAYVPPQMANGAVDWKKTTRDLQIDPSRLAQQVHIDPVIENGKIAGARLSGSGDVAVLMNKAGLKPSDVVTAINGKPVTSLTTDTNFVDNLKNASNLQVTVLRDGKPATLTVNLH